MSPDEGSVLFEVETPLGNTVRCSLAWWHRVLLLKHPVLEGREGDVLRVLASPDEVRRSRKDVTVLLFYRSVGTRWICAVARIDGRRGFLVTAYPTDAIKIGETVWTRSR